MRNATEEEKENIVNNIIKVYGIPNTYHIAFDKLWNHQIPESSSEWIAKLVEMKERLVEIKKEMDRLDKEYTALCYIGVGMFSVLTEEENENPDYQEI